MRAKRLWSLAGLVVLTTAAIGFWVQPPWGEQSVLPPDEPKTAEMPPTGWVEAGQMVQLDTSSRRWKPLSEDVGIMLHADEMGTFRGTLYVRLDERFWAPVGVQSTEELGPQALPLGTR